MQSDKKITCHKLFVINVQGPDKRGNTTELQVVQWIVDGESKSILVEKREYYTDMRDQKRKLGKAKGFNRTDFELISQNWDKIKPLLYGDMPPVPEDIRKEHLAAKQAKDTEVPY